MNKEMQFFNWVIVVALMVGLLAGVSWAEYPDRPITLIGIWGPAEAQI